MDILYEDNLYSETKIVPIESVFLHSEGENVEVTLPSINCILGDKMTAYAPNTTGIPYGAGKELEIIKQLFDVSKLFDLFDNISIVRDTFNVIAQKELEYRNKINLLPGDVLDDIFITSCVIAFRGAKRQDAFKELSTGVTKIKGYIYSENYILESGVLSAGKAAYLSRLLNSNTSDIGERFNPKLDLKSLLIPGGSFKQLNTIKKFSPEAFFYWYKAFELMEEGNLMETVENLK